MPGIKKGVDAVSAFMKGYIEQGITNNKESIDFHWDNIDQHIGTMRLGPGLPQEKERLNDLLKAFSENKEKEMIARTITFGEHLRHFIMWTPKDCKSTISCGDFRAIVYSFISIAEHIVERRVVDIALKIGKELENQGVIKKGESLDIERHLKPSS